MNGDGRRDAPPSGHAPIPTGADEPVVLADAATHPHVDVASTNGGPRREDGRAPHERLSNREHQVLCMIGRGLRVRDIADELHLSEKTISTYRTRLLEKLEVRTTAQIIRYAIQHDLSD